ncbi:MAG: hypothetical protein ACE5DM_01730 [Candidatus Nanoarchaeia archaeon]
MDKMIIATIIALVFIASVTISSQSNSVGEAFRFKSKYPSEQPEDNLSGSLQRLSSGERINSAKDDTPGLGKSDKIRTNRTFTTR